MGFTPQSFTLPAEGSSKVVMRYFSQRPNAYFVYGIGICEIVCGTIRF